MMRLKNLIPLLALGIFAAATLGLAGCGGGSNGGESCEDQGLFECSDGQCHACCDDEDCAADEECDEAYTCQKICLEDGADCTSDRGGCCDGLACDIFGSTCMPVCAADADSSSDACSGA